MIQTELFESHFITSQAQTKNLMIILHGKGDSLIPFKQFREELGLNEMNYLLLNAPKKFMDGFSWYGDPPYQRQGVLKIREKIFQLLSDLKNQGWKLQNIFFLGFSQGCLVSTDVALHFPEMLGGVVGVSGYFNFEPRWKKSISPVAAKTPWLMTHGNRDDILPIADTKYGVEKLKNIGLKIDWVEYEKEHTFEEQDCSIIRSWLKNQLSGIN